MQLRTSETISFTDIQRRAREIFESIETGQQEKYVILKNSQSPRPKGRGLWWMKPQVWIDQTQPRTSGYVADRLKTHLGMLPQSQALKVPVADTLRVSTKRIGT